MRRTASFCRPRSSIVALLVAASVVAGAAPVEAANPGSGNASINLTKTVGSTGFNAQLGLALSVNQPTAIPGDAITYNATVTNTGSAFTITGQFRAQNNGNIMATVADYYDVVEYYTSSTKIWTQLAGAEAAQPGYTPVVPAPVRTGMTLTATPIAASGVTYPSSGDPILGTQINAGSVVATWAYTAVLQLSPSQIATLSDPSKVSQIRNVVHFEVTPRALSQGQPFQYKQEFTDPFLTQQTAITSVVVTIVQPSGTSVRFDSGNTPGLASIGQGRSVSVTSVFTVPAPPAKGPGQSDTSYFAALVAIERLQLSATASARGSSGGVTVTAPAPPPVLTVEHLPIVSITKYGPGTVSAGADEVNPLALYNSGGAIASGLMVTDSVPSGSSGMVSGVPSTLGPGGSASPTATYPVPAGQAPGDLTDTASLSWHDANNNLYGPVSSPWTTSVRNNLAGGRLTLLPTTAGPDVVGTTQAFTATLVDATGNPIANQAVIFGVTGPNATSQAATTDAGGIASFSYGGATNGADQIQASASAGSVTLQSNTVTLNWIVPIVPASTSVVGAKFYYDNCRCLNVNPTMTPVFTQQFPTININPPTGSIPHMPSSIGSFNRPFVSVATDVAGNFSGATEVQGLDANGVLHQAGVNDLFEVQAVFTGALTVAKGGDLKLSFFVDDGFVVGIDGGVQYVSGSLVNPYPSGVMPFTGYPVVGAFNHESAPEERDVIVNFPAPGTYQYEIDYFECCGDGLAITVGTGGNAGMPPTGNLSLSPYVLGARSVGQSQTVSVAAMDASGVAMPNLTIDLAITGANARHILATTDSTGYATFTYQGIAAGDDALKASAVISGVQEISNEVTLTWNPAPPAPTISGASPAEGAIVTKPTPISATFAPPAGQSIASWSVSYQALDPGPVVTLNSGTGAPPATLATLDPTLLPNGAYALNITATASGGGVQTLTTTVVVFGYLKPGRYVTTYQDMSVPVVGFQMQVRRTYDSYDKETGDFGVGWHVDINNFRVSTNHTLGAGGWTEYNTQCGLGLCLTAYRNTAPRFVSVVFPDQHTEVFDFSANGGSNIFFTASAVYTPRPGTGTTSTLQGVGDGVLSYQDDGNLYSGPGQIYDPQQFKLTTHDGTVLILNRDGGLASITDRDGEFVRLSSSGFTSRSGQGIAFTRDSLGRITQITGPAGQVLTYTYTAGGDLDTYTDAVGNRTSFDYDTDHNLKQANGPAGQPLQTQQYDASGRLIAITDAEGNTAQITNNVAGRKQTVVDPTGKLTTIFTMDDLGDVLRQDQVFDGKTLTTTATYDEVGRPLTRKDPLGHTWSATYNANGDLLTLDDPLDSAVTITYDDFGAPLTFKDPIGNLSKYVYDSAGNLITFTNALNQSDHYAYSGSSFMGSHTDALNRTWSYNPDNAGNINAIRNPLGDTPTWAYDSVGNMTASRDAAGNTTAYTYDAAGNLKTVTDAQNHVTTLTYNALNELVSRIDALGGTTLYTYDGNRVLTSVTDPLGHVTSYRYDEDGRLTTVTDPMNGVTTYTYDGSGRLASEKDALNRTTRYTYDDAGRLLTKTMPNGGVFTYAYDAAGHQTSVTDPLNHKTSYGYDADGRLTSVTDPLNNITAYTLDALGRQVEVMDPMHGVTKHAYDAAGQLISDTDPLNKTTTYGYNNNGNRTSVTDPLNHTSTYGYDQVNRVNQVTDPLGRFVIYNYDQLSRVTSTRLFSGIVTHTSFDAVGHVSSTSDGLNNTTSYTYDAAGRQITMTDPRGKTTTYGYDAANRQTSITDALGGVVTIGYDLAGQQTSVVNPRGDTTGFTYDALGNMQTRSDPAGKTTSYVYDLAGRQTSMTDPRGVVVASSYDASDNLTGITFPGGSISQGYDALGRRTSMTDPTGTTNFGYDADSRLTSVAAPEGTVGYGYDAAGNRTSMTIPLRGSITYAYDGANQLTSLKDWANQVFSFTYAADGMIGSISRPGGVVTNYGYDGADRLTSVHHGAIANYDYTLDANGNRTAMISAAGTESYTLDALNRLTAVSYPNGDTASYTYDAAGNRLSSTLNGSTTGYTYDSAGRLASVGGTALTYDASSDITSIGSDTYSWDWAGRLASSTVGGLGSTYTYDGDGVRVGQTVAGVPTSYVWDRAGSLPLLVDDGNQGYVQTDQGVLEQLGTSATYPVADALGSVRNLATATPTVVGSTSYDAFGAVRSQSGQQSIFGFTGQQTDPTGLSFLRARYYNPVLGRFLSPDSIQPNAAGTQGFNLFAYAVNRPTRTGDPSGHGEPAFDLALSSIEREPVLSVIEGTAGQPSIWATVMRAALLTLVLALWLVVPSDSDRPQPSTAPTLDPNLRPNEPFKALTPDQAQEARSLGLPDPVVFSAPSPRVNFNDDRCESPGYRGAVQAQGNRPPTQKSVSWALCFPPTVAAGMLFVDILRSMLSPTELTARSIALDKVRQFIQTRPPLGLNPPGKNGFANPRTNPTAARVDLPIYLGQHFVS